MKTINKGTGYRLMSGAFNRIMDSIAVEFYNDQYPIIR